MVVIPGRPEPKARPRPGKRSWYVPSQDAQEFVAMHFVRYQGVYPPKTELSIRMMFHVSGRRAGDIDNLQKLVLDAIQDAGVVSNDMYVTEIHGSVDRCEKGQDRTAVVIHPR